MALSALDYPTDVAWERVCVSADMLDPEPCDESMPPKWNSSVAVFRYVPDDEYQVYPNRRILYYKVTSTLTSYQPEAQEVEGAIDWDKLTAAEVADFQERLKSYIPCNGAVLQISVTPRESRPIDKYPYFLDFQPKQRALYEQVSDTQEQASRSLDTVNVRKGGGTTDSVEALDIDQGFSVGSKVSAEGTGGGLDYSHTGQWGTKQVGQADATNVRTTDVSRETRDTLSHTTQLSQMYTLFQAYHLGTNRALFYLSPRPHTIEEPSGFIRGPRQLDGIQEIFLVVSQPKDDDFPCLTVRLDTAHLTTEDIRDYDRSQPPEIAEAQVTAPFPTSKSGGRVAVASDDVLYDCFELAATNSDTVVAPAGYVVETTEDLVNTSSNGSSTVTISQDKRTVTVSGDAHGHACFRNAAGEAANDAILVGGGTVVSPGLGTLVGAGAALLGVDVIAETSEEHPGSFHRKVQVNFRSEQATQKIGETMVLLVTSRALCCCEHPRGTRRPDLPPKIVGAHIFTPDQLQDIGLVADPALPGHHGGPNPHAYMSLQWTARTANTFSDVVGQITRRISTSVANLREQPALDTPYLLGRLTGAVLDSPRRRGVLSQPATGLRAVKREALHRLARTLGKEPHELTRYDVLAVPAPTLKAAGLPERNLLRVQLEAVGVPTVRRAPPAGRRPRATPS